MDLLLSILFASVFPFGFIIGLLAVIEMAGKKTLREAFLLNPFLHIWWAQTIIIGLLIFILGRGK